MDTDKQHYTWFDNGIEQQYRSAPFGIASLGVASSAIEKFLVQNSEGYIQAHMNVATELTRKSFQTAQQHKVCPETSSRLKILADIVFSTCRLLNVPSSFG